MRGDRHCYDDECDDDEHENEYYDDDDNRGDDRRSIDDGGVGRKNENGRDDDNRGDDREWGIISIQEGTADKGDTDEFGRTVALERGHKAKEARRMMLKEKREGT